MRHSGSGGPATNGSMSMVGAPRVHFIPLSIYRSSLAAGRGGDPLRRALTVRTAGAKVLDRPWSLPSVADFPHFCSISGWLLRPIQERNRMDNLARKVEKVLGLRTTFVTLLVLNVLVVFAMMWATRATVLSDTWSYLGLAQGILHGKYSMWWSLDEFYPDTFRTPGYPLFVATIISVFGSWKATYVVNLLLYWMAIYFSIRTIGHFTDRRSAKSLFLLLLLPMVNVPFYITQLYTEIPVLAAISVTLFVGTRPGNWSVLSAVGVGLLFGFIYQSKPVFLLFPLIYAGCAWLVHRSRTDTKGHLIMLAVFGLTLMPFGFWNLRNHGVFKVTPLEGGGGYMHFSYWCGKMPNYQDHISLRNFTGDELIRFVPEDSIPVHIEAFEQEWAEINHQLMPMLTAKDSFMLSMRPSMEFPVENTFNSEFTLMRERLLMRKGIERMVHDPWYTMAYKSYSAVRLWVIGIQKSDFAKASVGGKFKMLYATFSTLAMFLLFVIFIPLAYKRKVLCIRKTWPFLVYLAYFGLFHIPFTIQARYTTSVRFVMFALLALALVGLLTKPRTEQLAVDPNG